MDNLFIYAIAIPVIPGNVINILLVCNSTVEVVFIDQTPHLNTVIGIFIGIERICIGSIPTSRCLSLIGCFFPVPTIRCNNMEADPPAVLHSTHSFVLCAPRQFNHFRVFKNGNIALIICYRNSISYHIGFRKTSILGINLLPILIQHNRIRFNAHRNRLLIYAIAIPVKLITIFEILLTIQDGIINVSLIYDSPQCNVLCIRFICGISLFREVFHFSPTCRCLILIGGLLHIQCCRGCHLDSNPPTITPATNIRCRRRPFYLDVTKYNCISANLTALCQSFYHAHSICCLRRNTNNGGRHRSNYNGKHQKY